MCEDAVPAENQAGFRTIRQNTVTPLAVGEIFNTIWDCKELLEEQLIDYIRTILEKSLGAVAKGGNSILKDVLSYAEPLKNKGFNFMDSPGYDPVSVTGQVASGANVICFTTGRGSCYGCKPAPSLKLATNTTMFSGYSIKQSSVA